MKEHFARKVTLAGLLVAVAVVGSTFSFPVFSSKCAPVQHMVNILCAVLLGPGYGVAFMGVEAGSIAFYAYVVPFLVSTVGGSVLAGILVFSLERSGAMKSMRAAI